eukprot:gb/GECH01000430.1/.p1 GENE.gb/GECH01000430.1/~~gb/GECH01000430.1/.p1  ORF type:complete len:125 (+),score=30.19 gb/GECH01000430.1/:1-375(+)
MNTWEQNKENNTMIALQYHGNHVLSNENDQLLPMKKNVISSPMSQSKNSTSSSSATHEKRNGKGEEKVEENKNISPETKTICSPSDFIISPVSSELLFRKRRHRNTAIKHEIQPVKLNVEEDNS